MMNEFSTPVESYRERWITPLLRSAVQQHPVVVLTGARQVGKSTLLSKAEPFREWRLRSLDDMDSLRAASEEPESLWAGCERIVIDEVQRAPAVLLAIKRAVDRNPEGCRFVLSGSANLLLMKHISESLAGRAVYLVLLPMTIGEAAGRARPGLLGDALQQRWPAEDPPTRDAVDPVPWIQRGLMPALLRLNSAEEYARWWDGYVATYLERDLRQLTRIDALLDFRRMMELAALRTGQVVNQSDLARDARLSQPTVHRYLNVLETSHLFARLPPFLASRTSRLVKAPKAMWVDPGLAAYLAGYFTVDDVRHARELGSLFESLVYAHLRVLAGLMTPPARISYWRTRRGDEVDFVVEHGRRVLAVEVKLGTDPRYRDAAGLRAFLAEHPQASGGLLVHAGNETCRLTESILAVGWTQLAG